MTVAVAIKLVDLRPEIDPLSGTVRGGHRWDRHTLGVSAADWAAVETALRIGSAWGQEVVVVSVGPPEAEGVLREALTLGAVRAVRVELPTAGPHGSASSSTVAAALASVVGSEGPAPAGLVVCGAASPDRGSGSVPAFLAEELGAAQALGLVSLETAESRGRGELRGVRRLDGGGRERLRVAVPAVVSVEAGVAVVRRASLEGLLGARSSVVETALAPAPRDGFSGFPHRPGPFRPRPRALPRPDPSEDARRRALALAGAPGGRTAPRVVTADPERAADELLDYLREIGLLPRGAGAG
ncbi:electron transfer flavoprotein beta subunit [Spinactinospora alkalitolerans]|uniref:Electron transfer flavoprotein beta subunit n=1 Tax=Spinactinospora alkalitolerans TaxID=687207 RepID=A0A852TZJ1_9ACTN|nr:mycofactocin-associated electron transfer flavoprotein beta subunit [Spinactinospora alkalitolerans]NYE49231.1 electron transfer flavoprotein beta subunit [Spinactinospora alkalitolerans]